MSSSGGPCVRARLLDTALTVIGLCGVVLVFMPFAQDYVPVADIEWTWSAAPPVTLVLPCIILPTAISLGYFVVHLAGRLPRWASGTGWILAVMSAGAFLASMFRDLEASDPSLISAIAPFLGAFASAAWLSMKGVKEPGARGGLIAMQCVYVTLLVFAFAMAVTWGRFQVGAWFGVAAASAYLLQIAIALRRSLLILLMLAPLCMIWSVFTGMLGGATWELTLHNGADVISAYATPVEAER